MIINQKSIQTLRVFLDFFIINVSFIATAILAQSLDALLEKNFIFVLQLLLNIFWFFSSFVARLYDDFNFRPFSVQIINTFKVVIIQLIVSIVFIFAVKEKLFTRNFILYNTVFVSFIVLLKEYVVRSIVFSNREKSSDIKKLLIVGSSELGNSFKELIEKNPEYGFGFAGFINTEKNNDKQNYSLGNFSELEDIIVKNEIKDVVLALPNVQSHLVESAIKICDRIAVNSYIIPDYARYLSNKFQINFFGDFPIITVRNNPLEEIQWRILKRIFDMCFTSILFLLVLWWLIPLISIIIKLTSKGPVFFIQDRIGKDNKTFRCYKFRTMTIQASKDTKSKKAVTENDNRITKIGKFLRKSNLDEMPQFINVLIGNMSIVGPRPHAIPFNNMYGEYVEEIKLRHRVSPGISGWAQIHGLRGDVFDFEENKIRTQKRIEHDIWYIENWSFGLDLRIIFDTVIQIFTGKNKGS